MVDAFSQSYIALMIKHEMAAAALYTLFSNRISKRHAFWEQLATEEKQHAQSLRDLQAWLQEKRVSLVRPKKGFFPVEESLDWLLRVIHEAAQREWLFLDALELALALEDSMVESDYFQLFKGDCPEAQCAFTALLEHTQAHRQRIKEERDRISSAPLRDGAYWRRTLAPKAKR